MVLIPIATFLGLSHKQLEAILIHELAHVRRYDNIVNLFQRFAETILFFHPLVWWVSRCFREERERCCDDVVIAHTDRKVYAKALVALEHFRSPILAAAATDASPLSRVKRLLVYDGGEPRNWGRLTLNNLVSVLAAVAILTVVVDATRDTEAASDTPMDVAVDVSPALPHVGATLASCTTPMMQILGSEDWSMASSQGVLGHAFHFKMKEGGGPVMHDNIDRGLALGTLKKLANFRVYGTAKNKPKDRATAEREARDAVRESLARDVPALVWQPMTPEMKAKGAHAYCWGLIVGYNESDETYTLRHPNFPETYKIRYDEIGLGDGAQKFEILVFDKPVAQDNRARHLRALQNGVAFSHGTRYSNPQFIKDNGESTNPYGFAAYDLWRSAFDSAGVPLETSRYHAEILRDRRRLAASYTRSLIEHLAEAVESLDAAAGKYEA